VDNWKNIQIPKIVLGKKVLEKLCLCPFPTSRTNIPQTALVATLDTYDFLNTQVLFQFSLPEQASWVCQCDTNLVQKLELEFKAILGAPADLETWAKWLQSVVNNALGTVRNKTTFTKIARQFLLKWSFYR
jgi:hypothetical protein